MTTTAATLAPRHRIGDTSEVLKAIADPACSLAVWRRAPFADFAPLVAGAPRDLRFTCDLPRLPRLLAEGLAESGYGGAARLHAALVADAEALAGRFCAVLGLAALEVRLEVVRSDSCRRFHADYVTARLITTYLGEGTDWLDEADAARVTAGEAPRRINRLAAFDVGLFKGKLATSSPAIHRSPPIADTPGGARLLLVLNPAARPAADGPQSPLSPPGHLS